MLDVPAPLAAVLPLPDKRARRVLHGACNLAGTLFTVLGFVLAFVYHETKGVTANPPKAVDHFGLNEPKGHQTLSRPLHIIIGYCVVILVFLQCCAGLVKFVQRDGRAPAAQPPQGVLGKLLALHGRLGPLMWLGGLVCVMLAVYFEYLEVPGDGMDPDDKPHWNVAQLVIACLLVAALGITVIVYIHTGDRAAHDKAPAGGEGEGEYAADGEYVDVRGLLNA